jgi:putative flavoprotein involved in K+ transport
MAEKVEVAIIGAGQAGLATSWYLNQARVEHVVLDAGRVGETWRSRRWDSFCLVTPNWSVKLPGATYSGPDPDGFMGRDELIDHLQSWADSFHAPVQAQSPVSSLDREDGGFVLALPDRKLLAKTVVVATGAYQRAHRPIGSEGLPAGLNQLLAEEYSNAGALPPGAVLVVGSGQTGCQLAEELHEAGRTVLLACGRCPWAPRTLGGHDLFWWLAESGFLDRTPDKLPSPAARLIGNPQATGHGGGHDLHYRTLHAKGIELLGRFAGAEGSKIHFAGDLAASVDFGDARLADLWKFIEAFCKSSGHALPDFEWPEPLRLETRTELDTVAGGIGSVIWTSGYRPDYQWVHFPVFDGMGFPIQVDGRSSVPGLYFMGVPWMRKNLSPILYGVGEDAEIVARQIVAERQ